ncbi:glycoside hydrolase family 20 protein [Atractiella rhizophila]|nr:glycoside hydrolase family 20 protein [Atractiella rhizophila]
MVEVDSPGHMSAVGKAFPELGACIEASPWGTYAAEPPSGQVRLTDDGVEFVAGLFDELTSLTPGHYFSTGGDEVNLNCYNNDGPTQDLLAAKNWTIEDAVTNFVVKTHQSLAKNGKVPAVWDEIALNHQVGQTHQISNESLVIVWRDSSFVKEAIEANYKIIHAASNYFYLDCGAGGWVGDCPTCGSWCAPFKTWQHIYAFDPYANVTDDKRDLVIGGQTLLWAEQSGPENVDSIVWPRAAAAGELWWSGGGDVAEALPRLHDWSYRAKRRGIQTIMLQSEWCAYHPGKCDLTA